jgi:hypothetical protein
MVQPNYTPKEALERVKLMMSYDTSKTLNENKQIIEEQYVAPAAAATAAGAGLGLAAGTGAAGYALAGTSTGALAMATGEALGMTTGAAAMATGTAVLGGAVALAVLPLVYWLATKDTGANKVKKMFEMCSSEGAKIAKLPRKMDDATFRDMSDNIDDAINDTTFGIKGGTDEEKLFAQFNKLQDGTASDFCAFVKYYNSHSDSGDLFDDLDSDIDAEDEWKKIYRPIRNCVEDSLLTIKDDTIEDCKQNPNQAKCKGGKKGGGYKPCSRNYTIGCMSEVIKQVQGCLSLVQDGKYGKKTKAALASVGFPNGFTDADVEKICKTSNPQKKEVNPWDSLPDTIDSAENNTNNSNNNNTKTNNYTTPPVDSSLPGIPTGDDTRD